MYSAGGTGNTNYTVNLSQNLQVSGHFVGWAAARTESAANSTYRSYGTINTSTTLSNATSFTVTKAQIDAGLSIRTYQGNNVPTTVGISYVTDTSPLILDLNGDGLQTVDAAHGAAFDLAANGHTVKTGWVAKGDGLLALDLNHNGVIDSGAELFGNATTLANGNKAVDGWQALATLDTNGDGVIDAKDAQFADLRVWVDANGNGHTDAGELMTLAALPRPMAPRAT